MAFQPFYWPINGACFCFSWIKGASFLIFWRHIRSSWCIFVPYFSTHQDDLPILCLLLPVFFQFDDQVFAMFALMGLVVSICLSILTISWTLDLLVFIFSVIFRILSPSLWYWITIRFNTVFSSCLSMFIFFD